MKQEEIQNQIKKLEKEYADLKEALASLTSNFSNTSILRGILSGAGSAAELILKCVYRKEITLDEKIPAERAEEMKRQASEKLMLDELIKNVESKIPLRILTHLRTIQAWRNIGSHDKGEEINETVNSSSLQVVSLAVNELIIWFVSEYLNLDATNFIDNSAEENTIVRNSNADSIEAWKEAYWYAMKDGSISRLAQSKLDFLSKKLNLTEEEKNKVIASFERNETEFVELINEIFKNSAANNLDLEELEHVDFIRQECCISEKEASELLQYKTFNNKIIVNKDKISTEWIRNLIPDAEKTVVEKETKHEVVKPEIKTKTTEIKIQEESITSKSIEIQGIDLLDKLTKEKELNDQLEKEIGSAELNFLWTSVVPLLDFICFVNYERKYKINHLGSYYSFIRGDIPESYFRDAVRHNVFNKGQFNEMFHCDPEIIDIRVERSNNFFKLKITGINWVATEEGLKEVKRNYNSIDELVLDITKFLVEKAVILK